MSWAATDNFTLSDRAEAVYLGDFAKPGHLI
jgi:hypothetical protein